MSGLFADIRHAIRIYGQTPGSSLIAVAVLAVGMAFVGAFLSLYVDLVLRPHPGFEQSGRLVTLGQTDGELLRGLSLSLIEDMAEEVTSLDAIAGFMTSRQVSEEGGEPIMIELVTREFFGGIRPRLHSGRGFEPADHDAEAEPVAVVSYRYWQDQLEGRADVLDTTLPLELQPMYFTSGPDGEIAEPEDAEIDFRIVGIMSPDMGGVTTDNIAIWLPLERAGQLLVVGVDSSRLLSGLNLQSIGRKRSGVSTNSVLGEMRVRYADGTQEFNFQPGLRFDAYDGLVRNINVQRESKRQLQLFLGASVLLALVAAANVSLFLLARAPGRRRELGIRMSVGAPVKRLARQLASESALLVAAAAVIGLLLSIWLSNFLRGLAFLQQAQWREVTLLDWRVLVLVGSFLLVLALLVSLAPILGLKRLGIAGASRQVAARATVAQRIAGTVQIAIAGMLGGAAVAFGWYLAVLMFGDPGYAVSNRHVAQYSISIGTISFEEYRALVEAQQQDLPRRREALESLPGIRAVAFGQPVPGMGWRSWTQIPDPNEPGSLMRLTTGMVDTRYVDVLGLRLLHGRAPDANDGDNAALVNRALAQTLWGRDDVVGESVPLGPGPMAPQVEVIGVLQDLSFEHPSADVEPILFRLGTSGLVTTVVIDSTLTAAALQQTLESAAEPGDILRVANVRPLDLLRNDLLAADRARGFLTIGTAALVVVLAAFGFYGTQRYLVTAGRREYAIRASLGAGPKALGRLVFGRGLLLSLPGLVAGSLLAFILVAFLRDDYLSPAVPPLAVSALVGVGLILLLLAASLGPAQQARRTQPAPLLRED